MNFNYTLVVKDRTISTGYGVTLLGGKYTRAEGKS